MMKRLLLAALASFFLSCGPAHAAFELGTGICETTTTTGTGTIDLAGAYTGGSVDFLGFASQITSTNSVPYTIESSDGKFEHGVGVFTDGTPDTLTRVADWSSDGTGAELDLPAGTHIVCLQVGEESLTGGVLGASFLTITNAGIPMVAADAGADAVFGFDDTAGQYENLTAGEVVDIIETADGAGSGLDADTLDSLSSASFYQVGGTDVALADGGTGASLADPNDDRILFWDDSGGAIAFLDLGNGLTTSTTNLVVDSASTSVDGISEFATAAEYWTGTATDRSLVVDQVWAAGALQTLTSTSNATAVNLGAGINFTLALGENSTLSNPTGDKVGQTGIIYVTATGATRTLDIDTEYVAAGGTFPLSIETTEQVAIAYWVRTTSEIWITGVLRDTGPPSSSGATTALDNLASVAVNTDIISDTDSTDSLGSTGIRWLSTWTDQLNGVNTAFADAGADAVWGWDDTAGTYENLTAAEVLAFIEATTPLVSTAEGDAAYQPLDADLTSWAAITRASGFDTFTATPSSANFASLVTGETGSGAVVFATSPALTTPNLGTPSAATLTNADGYPESFITALSDETTAIAPGTATDVVTWRMPYAFTVTAVNCSLNSGASTGTFTVDINENNTSILGNKVTFDATETSSLDDATQPTITDASIAANSEIEFDIDDDGAGDATGLKCTIIGVQQ